MDKRILKTKRALKESLLFLIRGKEFDAISTTEICKRAMVSRNTFYTYYADKYALLEECFSDYEEQFLGNFQERQGKNNPCHDMQISFMNLIDTFLDTESISHSISIPMNFDLTSLYYRSVLHILRRYENRYAGYINPKYDLKQLNSFLILGFWGFIHGNVQMDRSMVRERTRQLMQDLLDSPIFQMKER